MRIATPPRVLGLIIAVLISLGLICGFTPPSEAHTRVSQASVSALPQGLPMPDSASSDSWGVDSNCGGEGAITAKNTFSFRDKKEELVSRQDIGTITIAKSRVKKNTYLIRANNATGKKQKMDLTGYVYDHGKNYKIGRDKGKVKSYVGCIVITLADGEALSFRAKITVAKKGKKDPVYHRYLNGVKWKDG